eukprot:gene9972-13443_t
MDLAHHVPRQLEAALALLSQGECRVISGGTDVFPAIKAGQRPVAFVDLSRIHALKVISRDADGWVLGAGLTWSDILRADLPAAFDGLKQAAREVGSLQIQNAGTIGGNLCNASPAADGAPALMALDASVDLASTARGVRRLPLSAFLLGVRQTALQADELLTAVIIPKLPETAKSAFVKLGARRYLVISIAMVAVVLNFDLSGRIVWARVAVGSCAPVARRLPLLEAALVGLHPSEVVVLPEHL